MLQIILKYSLLNRKRDSRCIDQSRMKCCNQNAFCNINFVQHQEGERGIVRQITSMWTDTEWENRLQEREEKDPRDKTGLDRIE